MKKVRDNSAVPRVPWKYVNEDGYTMTDVYYGRLKQTVKKYRQANGFPIGLLFDDEFERNICGNAPDEMCEEFIEPSLFAVMSNAGKALVRLAKNIRRPLVDEVTLQDRQNKCEPCNFYGGSSGIFKVNCKKCGCGGLKAYLQSEKCPAGKW